MGALREPERALLFAALLFRREDILSDAVPELTRLFGKISLESTSLPWDYSDYYRKELGEGILRKFLFFDALTDPSHIVRAKKSSMKVEELFSVSGLRRINIDPGYVTLSKVVLATTKDYCHRIYLGQGIYGEVTLIFRDRRFQPLPFTYNDYRSDEYIRIFSDARDMLRKRLSG